MRCRKCGVVTTDGDHQCDPSIVEAREKVREQWRKEAEEDARLEAAKNLPEPRREKPRSLAGPPLYQAGLTYRQRAKKH